MSQLCNHEVVAFFRLSFSFSDLCETLLTIVFVACLTSICAAMLLIQIQIVKYLLSLLHIYFIDGHVYIPL